MKNQTTRTFSLFYLLLALLLVHTGDFLQLAGAGKGRVHISDDLDDVIDDEEDDDWKNWGKKPPPSPDLDISPSDLDKMEYSQMQEELMKRNTGGPVFGFVKLRLGVQRAPDDVAELAMKWTQILKSGGVGVRFMGVDLNTVMFTMERGQDRDEVKEYILEQEDAYEVKIGDQVFRRAGDPPLEELMEELHREKGETQNDAEDKKEEL